MDINLKDIITVPRDISERLVLFLDIDGVLNAYAKPDLTNNYTKDKWRGVMGLDRRLVNKLNEFTDVAKPCIVISSSWGLNQDTLDALEFYGATFTQLIVGETPRHFRHRGQQIKAFLDEYGIEKYIVLDDECKDIHPYVQKGVFETDGYVGITRLHLYKMMEYIEE